MELEEFEGFQGKAHEEGVMLSWKSFANGLSGTYVVQHSTDEQSWQDIGRVDSISPISLGYRFFHASPSPPSNYYRLKQVDQEGNVRFSNSIEVLVDIKTSISIISHHSAFLSINIDQIGKKGGKVSIYDGLGKLVDTSQLPPNQAHWQQNFLSGKEGIYVVVVEVGKHLWVKKVFVGR